ncbi:MAG: polysaccharide biosynthesis tyrosine autokinase [candidate division WOR-3 bacterium]
MVVETLQLRGTGVPLAYDRQQDPARILQRSVSARALRDADIIRLTVVASKPELAQSIAQAYIDAYQAYEVRQSCAAIRSVKEFLQRQLAVVGARLDSAERRLENYKRTNHITDISEETKAAVERQSNVLALYHTTGAEREALERELTALTGTWDSLSLDNHAEPLVAALREELARLEAERTNLLIQGFSQNSHRLESLVGRIAALKEQLATETARFTSEQGALDEVNLVVSRFQRRVAVENELARLAGREAALARMAANYDRLLNRLPQHELALARLSRDVAVDRQVFALLAERFEETRIQEAGRISGVRVVDPPRPGVKVRPNARNSLVMALILGLSLGFATGLVVDRLDTVVRRPEDLERLGVQVLASVPRLSNAQDKTVLQGPEDLSAFAEAFRILRTSIIFAAGGNQSQTIAVTSASPAEGKTTVAANLAQVLSQSGKRTLLIDADLRKPRLHIIYGRKKKPGLTDTVMLNVPLDQALHRFAESPGTLDILFAGTAPPSPVDFLSSPGFDSFLKQLSAQYDYIVIDTPPALISADSSVLASRVTGVLLVVRIGRSDSRAVSEAHRLLNQAGAKLLGVVANQLKPPRRYGYYRYRYYHYRYGTHASTIT